MRRIIRLGIAGFAFQEIATAQLTKPEMESLEPKLPPVAQTTVDFDRDIRPILENSCFRCHGPERPKGKLRLDERASALKGGNNGVDIVPGESAHSPLIYYTARLVEDMEMPPNGKGDPLTSDQVGLLRAWIDQGAKYSEKVEPKSKFHFAASPVVQWVTVKGDIQKFREQTGLNEGASGGLQSFSLEQDLGKGRKLTFEGRSQYNPDDHLVKMRLAQRDLGYAEFGYLQYHKFYDDTGGYIPGFAPSTYNLDRNLDLEIGRAWAEFGLRLPDKPRITIGYEYQYRDGSKSTLQWGDVGLTAPANDISGTDAKKIYPGIKDIDEKVHIIKFDLAHEIAGFGIENNFRTEFYDNNTRRNNVDYFNLATQQKEKFVLAQESNSHFQASDSIRLDKQVMDWLYLSGGYYYSKFDGQFGFSEETVSPVGTYAPDDKFWFAQNIVLDQDTHIFNLNTQLGPWAGLTLYGGAQNSWMNQKAMGTVDLAEGVPGALDHTIVPERGDLDRVSFQEYLGARYTKIPFTVLFAEGRLQQEEIGQVEEQQGGAHEFFRDTDAQGRGLDGRVGFTISPWTRVSLTAQYKHRDKDWDYNHLRDESFGIKNEGYSAFITDRRTKTEEFELKLSVRPAIWLKTTVSYANVASDFTTTTESYIIPGFDFPGPPAFSIPPSTISPGGSVFAGNYDAHVVSASASITPWQRLYLNGTVSYRNTRTTTAFETYPEIAAYKGDIYSIMSSGTFALNKKTDLNASYTYSWADYGQNNFPAGLPLGIIYDWHSASAGITRKISTNMTAQLQYRFWYYDEANTDGRNNYVAHGLLASLSINLH